MHKMLMVIFILLHVVNFFCQVSMSWLTSKGKGFQLYGCTYSEGFKGTLG